MTVGRAQPRDYGSVAFQPEAHTAPGDGVSRRHRPRARRQGRLPGERMLADGRHGPASRVQRRP
jgi:hypothetical protein